MFYEFRVNSQFVSRQRWGSWRTHVLGAKTRFRDALCLQGWRYHAPSSHQEQTVTAIRRNKASNHVRLGFWAFPWVSIRTMHVETFRTPGWPNAQAPLQVGNQVGSLRYSRCGSLRDFLQTAPLA